MKSRKSVQTKRQGFSAIVLTIYIPGQTPRTYMDEEVSLRLVVIGDDIGVSENCENIVTIKIIIFYEKNIYIVVYNHLFIIRPF